MTVYDFVLSSHHKYNYYIYDHSKFLPFTEEKIEDKYKYFEVIRWLCFTDIYNNIIFILEV